MKSLEKFFNVNMGAYSGVLVREKAAKKLSKILYKQNQELKEFLVANIDALEVSDWTLAYPNGEQTHVRYFNPDKTKEDVMFRINLIDRSSIMNYEPDVFLAKSMDEAKEKYMEWFENTNIESEE